MARLQNAAQLWGSDSQRVSRDARWLSRRIVSFELQIVTDDAPKDLSAAFIARELERVRLHGFTRDELRRVREPEPRDVVACFLVQPDLHCERPVERTLRGFVPLSCGRENRLVRELEAGITDDEIDALRSTVNSRDAAYGSLSSERGGSDVASMKTAIARALAQPIARWTEVPALMPTPPRPGRIVRENRIADGVQCAGTDAGGGRRFFRHIRSPSGLRVHS